MSSSSPDHELARWEKLSESTQARTRVFDVLNVHYRHPRRERAQEFAVIKAPDWVNVVALTTDQRIVLVRQFRYGINEFSLETPGGVMEAGEEPIATGLRELREETGYTGGKAVLLGFVHPNPAIQSNRCHFVLVEGVVKSHEFQWDADEEIQVTAEPVDDVLAMTRSGRITHSLVLNALALFEHQWRTRK